MPNKQNYSEENISQHHNCGTCGKTNHPEQRCWQGAGAHLKPTRIRPQDSSDNDLDSKAPKPHKNPTSSNSQSSSMPWSLLRKPNKKTSFATTPIQPTSLCPTKHQMGPSNTNFSPPQTTIDGQSCCRLAATNGKSYHYYLY